MAGLRFVADEPQPLVVSDLNVVVGAVSDQSQIAGYIRVEDGNRAVSEAPFDEQIAPHGHRNSRRGTANREDVGPDSAEDGGASPDRGVFDRDGIVPVTGDNQQVLGNVGRDRRDGRRYRWRHPADADLQHIVSLSQEDIHAARHAIGSKWVRAAVDFRCAVEAGDLQPPAARRLDGNLIGLRVAEHQQISALDNGGQDIAGQQRPLFQAFNRGFTVRGAERDNLRRGFMGNSV